jgi:hypothetical protein
MNYSNIIILLKRNGIFPRKWLKNLLKAFAEIDVNGRMNRPSSSEVREIIFFDSTPTIQPV